MDHERDGERVGGTDGGREGGWEEMKRGKMSVLGGE